MQLADALNSLRKHWRVSIALLLLSASVLGIFLFTRSEVRDDDKWVASAQLLVPARNEDGGRPEGVPPVLLQGQATIGLSQQVKNTVFEAGGIVQKDRSKIVFGFSIGESREIITLSITAPERELAVQLVGDYTTAYVGRRSQSVADTAISAQKSARIALATYEVRLGEVEDQLSAIDPALLTLLEDSSAGSETTAIAIPEGTPIDTALLIYERSKLLQRINATRASYAERSLEAIVPQSFSGVVERPPPRQITPELPSPLPPAAIALGIGVLLALLVPVLMDRIDHTIRDAKSALKAFEAPVLSSIPASKRSHRLELVSPGTKHDAAYRALAATSIATDQLPRAIVVTSPVGKVQDGVAANFAAALAGLGLKVALVPTQKSQSWFLELTDVAVPDDFPDALALAHAGQLNGQLSESLLQTRTNNLWVLPAGTAGDDTLLEGMPTLLEALSADIDVTVIAGPALLEDPAATILAWSTRSVLWVVEAGEVTEHEAHEAKNRLGLAGASAFGVTLVDADS